MKDYQSEILSNQWGVNVCIHNAWGIAEPLLEYAFGSPVELYTTIAFCLPFCADEQISILSALLVVDDKLPEEKPGELSEFLWSILFAGEGDDFEESRIKINLLIFMLELHNSNYHHQSGLEYRAYYSFGEAMLACGEARSCFLIDSDARRRSNFARSGALGRLKNDPKQAAKQQVRECWERWQKNMQEYRSKSAFARAMLDKYERLGSQRVIERWCKEWESEPCQ